MDFSRMKAVRVLLGNNWNLYNQSVLTMPEEMKAIKFMANGIQTNRMFKLMASMADDRINNSRTKKQLMMKTLIESPNFELWAVKYRSKVKKILTHVLGNRRTSIIKSVLFRAFGDGAMKWTNKEKDILNQYGLNEHRIMEIVGFVLGNKQSRAYLPSNKLLRAYSDAKTDFEAGKKLPKEVLEGIRSTYHKDLKTSKDTLEAVTKSGSITQKQRMQVQAEAEKKGVKVKWDPTKQDLVSLFVYAFERGLDNKVGDAINQKAKRIAQTLPIRYESIGIVIDDSFSMSGSKEQPLRPMAVARALERTIANVANEHFTKTSSGRPFALFPLQKPSGSSDIATPLAELLMNEKTSAFFIISDGFENAPAGRTDELLHLKSKLGDNRPVYQVNPVASAKAIKSVRTLSSIAPSIAAGKPEELTTTLITSMFAVDPKKAIQAVVGMALPLIESRDALTAQDLIDEESSIL
jgi:hypothetical protein